MSTSVVILIQHLVLLGKELTYNAIPLRYIIKLATVLQDVCSQ